MEWPRDGDGCRWKPESCRVYLQGVGDVKVDVHRPVEGMVKTIAVKREGRWTQFASILVGKAEEAGRSVIRVDPRHTSQTCAACGHVDAVNRVSQAEFRCQRCGHTTHADVNAARNILRAGLALPAANAA